MARVLIAFTSHEGQTEKIVGVVAAEVRALGHEVDVVDLRHQPAETSGTLEGYDGFLVAGSIHLGRHDPALVRFVTAHLDLLEQRPSALLSVSGAAASADPNERAAAQVLLQELLHATGWHPRLFDAVGGAVMYTKYGRLTRLAMRFISWREGAPTDTSRDYEMTDWAAVRGFARDLVAVLERGGGEPARAAATLLDRHLPFYDATVVRELAVAASPERTWAGLLEADLGDNLVLEVLNQLRAAPEWLARKLHGEAAPARVPRRYTFGDLIDASGSPFRMLALEPGHELVAYAVGRVWQPVIEWAQVAPEAFASFAAPRYAKIAIGLRVEATDDGGSRIRYEARTATTDEAARRRFGIYWALIGRFAGLLMGEALEQIRAHVEREGQGPTRAPSSAAPA